MQKQRSPYTGGGFNLQQLKATTFGKNEALNGIPFLMQLAHKVQVQKRPIVHQHLSSSPAQPLHLLGNAGGHGVGHERGLRSGTPRTYLNHNNSNNSNNSNSNSNNSNNHHGNNYNNNNYNGSYEGEMMPPLSLGLSNSNMPVADECLHLGHMSNMDHMDQMDHMGHMSSMGSMNNMDHMDHIGNMNNMSNMNNMGYVEHMSNMGSSEQLIQPDTMPMLAQQQQQQQQQQYNKSYQSDTDSETEYSQHMQSFETGIGKSTRWRRLFDYLKSGMPPQRQERMETVLQRCCENTFFSHMLLVLQLLIILIGGAAIQGMRFSMNITQLSFRLWRCKFQLRSLMRLMLWRMANAKGNDAVLFLGVMLLSPWLFLISLIGFAISFTFQFKEGLSVTLRQLRLQMLN